MINKEGYNLLNGQDTLNLAGAGKRVYSPQAFSKSITRDFLLVIEFSKINLNSLIIRSFLLISNFINKINLFASENAFSESSFFSKKNSVSFGILRKLQKRNAAAVTTAE